MKTVVRFLLCLPLLCAPLLAGCGGGSGEKKVKTNGRLHNKGVPLTLENKMAGAIELKFYAIGDGKGPVDPKYAVVKDDGSFVLDGTDGAGVAPGKYKIVVHQYDPRPVDKLKDMFSEKNTKIVRDIAEGAAIDIDVSKPEGK
ncbi:MAG: hypothetical protein U0793_10555 [Gemmataceae bacterium]